MTVRDQDIICLSTPATSSSVSILRAVAANVAAQTETTFDAVEDLRLAVAEACNRLLEANPEADRLRMDVRVLEHAVRVEVSIESPTGAKPDPGGAMPWQIIEALTEHAEETVVEGRPTIVMQVSMVPTPR